jgi:hypothetical protein
MAKQQGIIEDARSKLLDSDDPKDHRRIVQEAKGKLASLTQDNGPPSGATHIGTSNKDGKDHYLDASGKDLGVKQ